MKTLWINLIKYMQDLYTENCKMLLREIKEDPPKKMEWYAMCMVGRLNIVKSDLPKLVYRFNSIHMKISACYNFL